MAHALLAAPAMGRTSCVALRRGLYARLHCAVAP